MPRRRRSPTRSAPPTRPPGEVGDPDALETDLARLRSELHGKEREIDRLNGELTNFEGRYHGGAAKLEERLAYCEAEEARLVRARDAASLARGVIDRITDDVHKNFAPHLNEQAAQALADITKGRYTEVSVDPKDFALRVRAPESGAIVEMNALSTGTQEQLSLSLQALIARLSARDERVPLILDDALAHSDDQRLARAVERLAAIAGHQQVLLFTHRDTVLEAARRLKDVTVVHLKSAGSGQAHVSRALRLGVDAANLPRDRRGMGRYVRSILNEFTSRGRTASRSRCSSPTFCRRSPRVAIGPVCPRTSQSRGARRPDAWALTLRGIRGTG